MACISPIHIENKSPTKQADRYVPVPCGKCPECIKRRASQWIFRLKQQEKVSSSAHFVTLTYNSDTVPLTKNGYMTLQKTDVQKFFKRLRKINGRRSIIKYYLAGEYGSQFKRPHYHIILFNSNETDILCAWQLGQVVVGDVNGNSIAYTTAYINKGKIVPEHKRDDREKEFSLMSKGLGLNYITEDIRKYHNDDISRQYLIESGNKKIAMPRYYRDRLYTEDEVKTTVKDLKYKIDQKEQEKMSDFVRRTGSLKGYSRSKEEATQAYSKNFREAERLKRKF